MNQQEWELWFWRREIGKGVEAFLEQREADWSAHAKNFPELLSPGKILEIGTGLVSVFEFSDRDCTSIDPLQPEYMDIYKKDDSKVNYQTGWNEILESSFDEALCVNVIDHTPEPQWLMDKIKWALKPDGKLYFQVNFDRTLSPAHYSIWDKVKVDSFMVDWTLERDGFEEVPANNQTRYWAVFICNKKTQPETQVEEKPKKRGRPVSSSQATSSTKRSGATKKSASTPSKLGRPKKNIS